VAKSLVLMVNMGGPTSLDDVEPYLVNIFMDPHIFSLPLRGRLRQRFVRWFAARRAPKSRAIYERLGGASPLTDIAKKQAQNLEHELLQAGMSVVVRPAMRYWQPFLAEELERAFAANYERIMVLSMYPYYSSTTTGSHLQLIDELCREHNFPRERISSIDRFGDDPRYIKAIADHITDVITAKGLFNRPLTLLCSAHSIPLARVRKGDPYAREIERSWRALRERLPSSIDLRLSYQSKIGPVKWLSPATDAMIDQLASEEIKQLFVYPFGFLADNSETVYEIGMLYREQAEIAGIDEYFTFPALNNRPDFIAMLAALIAEHWRQ
jgi:ferrochelatase